MSNKRIVLVGAGSASFGLGTVSGLFGERKALQGSTLVLVDIDEPSLQTMAAFVRQANTELGHPFSVEATADRREALPGADFVTISVEKDRWTAWKKDWDIPIEHGIRHIFGENGGPGGLSHSLRTIQLTLEICRDLEALAPDALVLNYTNPMSRVCMALTRYTNLRVIGLCHGIADAYEKVGTVMGWVTPDFRSRWAKPGPNAAQRWAEISAVAEYLDLQACGINHLTFITDLRDRRTGEDLYSAFRERLANSDPHYQPVSKRLHDVFGLYPAQADDHVGEYVSWARNPNQPEALWPLADWVPRWVEKEASLREDLCEAAAGRVPTAKLIESNQSSHDRAAALMAEVVEGHTSYELAVNIVNNGCISGLPDWAVVEVPGVVGAYGVKGVSMGALPPGLTAVLNNQIAIQDRVVEAAVHGDRKAAMQALLLDPVSNHDADEANAMLEDLLAAQASHLRLFA